MLGDISILYLYSCHFLSGVDDMRNCKADDDKGCKYDGGISEERNCCSAQHQQVSVREPDVGGVVTYVCKTGVQPLGSIDT